jgi:hypothetical protein
VRHGAVSIGSDHSNRTIALVVTSGSITRHASIVVTGASLQATASAAAPAASATVQYHLVDSANAAIVGVPVLVTLAQATVTGTTDANGKYTFSYTVPSTASVAITAKAAGVETDTVIPTSLGVTSPASGTVLAASVAANPSNVPINAVGSTTNQVEVRALFLGASNAPIQFERVRFDLAGDVNGIGGSLTSGTDYVYTDANGVARTTYTPGSRSSGNQALTIRACYSGTEFAVGTCPNASTTVVTVVSTGVSVSIFNNGLITANDTQSIYQIAFAVQVVDSVGQPIQGVLVSGSVDLPRYYRGQWTVNGGSWSEGAFNSLAAFVAGPINVCDNEDINRNDVMETSSVYNEDANGSGKLEPYKADAAIVVQSAGSNTTDAFGKAYFLLQYGQNLASWDDFAVTFSSIVQGTEGRATYSSTLPVPSDALTDSTKRPPFSISPYNFSPVGVLPAVVGVRTVTDPSSGKTGVLCLAQH